MKSVREPKVLDYPANETVTIEWPANITSPSNHWKLTHVLSRAGQEGKRLLRVAESVRRSARRRRRRRRWQRSDYTCVKIAFLTHTLAKLVQF
jgi:hypothetical protein